MTTTTTTTTTTAITVHADLSSEALKRIFVDEGVAYDTTACRIDVDLSSISADDRYLVFTLTQTLNKEYTYRKSTVENATTAALLNAMQQYIIDVCKERSEFLMNSCKNLCEYMRDPENTTTLYVDRACSALGNEDVDKYNKLLPEVLRDALDALNDEHKRLYDTACAVRNSIATRRETERRAARESEKIRADMA